MNGVPEEEVHAYVDGQLDPERIAAMEHLLQDDPEAARRVAAYRAQRAALRAAFPRPEAEPLPAALDVASLIRERGPAPRRSRFTGWRIAAGLLVAFVAGSSGGWLMRGTMPEAPPGGIPALAQEAVVNHVVYAADHGRPVELRAAQQADLIRWLSNRLHRPLMLPDLEDKGFRFMGGRLVATRRGPAALLMYDDDHGTRLTVYARPMSQPAQTRTVAIGEDGARGYAWVCDGLGYAVVGDDQTTGLDAVAKAVRNQVDPS
jgi:anti-sigma factor RsiW